MRQIVGIEKAKERLGEFAFSEFRIVRELRFYETFENHAISQNIDMIVESEDRKPNYRIQIRFSGISGLRIENFGGGETRIIGLDIVDISAKQWENILWEIIDFEHNSINSYAKSAEIVSVIQV